MRWFWIDRYTEYVCGDRATAVKNVSLSEDHMHDHFKGYPIMPNCLIIEGMAQAGGLLVSESQKFETSIFLGKVAKSVFHFPAKPGDTLTYRVKIESLRDSGSMVTATSHVGDRLQAEAELFFAFAGDTDSMGVGGKVFDPEDLLQWLSVIGVFDVGVRADGTPISMKEYPVAVLNGWC